MMNKEIELKRGEGNFYAAMAFHWTFVMIFIVPVFLLILIAIVNPLWFRDDFFRWIENGVNRLSRWRNYQKYHIYLGTDPKLWHTLKGDLK
jgi:hypothetical protein